MHSRNANKPSDSGSTPTTERRVAERVRGETIGPVQFRAEQNDVSFLARIADYSIHGMGLLVISPVVSGSRLTILAGPAGKRLNQELTADVRHTTQTPDGHWLLGCSLSRTLTLDDVMALG